MNIIVGMADMKVTSRAEASLITYALGSCIGVTLYDPLIKVGGLLHFMLPDSKIALEKACLNPWMFATTGIPKFFQEAYRLGAEKHRLIVRVVGGAQVMDDAKLFDIGKKNYMTLREIFRMNYLPIHAEDVGGSVHRTIRLEVSSGRLFVKTSGGEEKEL